MKKVEQRVVSLRGDVDDQKVRAWAVVVRVSDDNLIEGYLVRQIIDEFLICLN